MDKGKKASSKKNKLFSSQSSAKGRDVTDHAHDKTARVLAAAASSSVESADRQKEEIELNRLRQENQELLEIKRRHEATISALGRSGANTTQLMNSLMGVGESFTEAGEVPLEQILKNCIRQRDELLEIKKISERQSAMLKKLRETITSGGCLRCTFRRSYEDLDVPLTTAVQCTEPPSTGPNQTRQVLLNDGRQFVLSTTAAANDSAAPAASSSAAGVLVTADHGARTASDTELVNDLSLRDETQADAAAARNNAVPPCPVCHRSGFVSHMELNLHVNNTHLDVEDNVD